MKMETNTETEYRREANTMNFPVAGQEIAGFTLII